MERVIRETEHLSGDILEFGVALGGSGILLARHARAGRRYIGFDVFGMIPAPTSEKDDAKAKQRYEVIKSGVSKGIGGDGYYGYREDLLSEVKQSFARHGVPVDGQRVVLHQGLFQETWPAADVERVSLAHIDCDWYDPVRYCLNASAEKLDEKGVIIIDDYNDYGGCRAAVEEFLGERKDFYLEAGPNPFLRKRV
jgi:asparagine synthase (glutamine-hydrolysing)